VKPFYLQELLSDLKGTNVIDMSGFKIGKVSDFVIDGNYSLTKVILRHSLLEEIAKKLHLKPKVHYVIPIDALKNGMSGDYLEVITSLDELLKESDDDAINQDERKFSKILRKKITDKNGEHVGRIIDAIVHIDCKLSFILGGSLFEEIREDLGMIPDLDIFLPCNLIIREDGNTFHIKSDKSALSKKATRDYPKRLRERISSEESISIATLVNEDMCFIDMRWILMFSLRKKNN
jgi:sporulation protein YlmC with PRC-barrel domain